MWISRALPKILLLSLMATALVGTRFNAWVDHWAGIFPLLLAFVGFSAGIWGWGRFLAQRWGFPSLAEAFLFSTLVGTLFPFALGHLAWLNSFGYWLAFVFLALGIFLTPPNISAPARSWFSILFGLVVAFRFFNAYLPNSHGDPFIYHLLAPQLWVAQGAVRLAPELPNALLASAWEYFYIWPQLFFGRASDTHGLVLAQLFCQWMHLLWGWIGIPVVLDQILFPAGANRQHRRVVFLSLLFISSLQWTAGLAKNDCGIALWSLGAFYFWNRALQENAKKYFLWAGVFAGLAVAGKLNAAIFLVPSLFVSLLFSLAREPRMVPKLTGAVLGGTVALLSAGVFFLRNYLETKNPFFPMFQTVFPSPWVSQSWADHFSSMHPHSELSAIGAWWFRAGQFFRENPLTLGWLALPPLAAIPRGREFLFARGRLCAAAFVTFGFFALVFGTSIEMRHLGAALPLLVGLGAATLCFVSDLFPSSRARQIYLGVLVVAVLACSKLPLHLIGKAPKIMPGAAYLLTHTAGDAKAWLRANVKNGELVVVVADNETYYLSGLRVTVMSERPDIDRATYGVKDFSTFVRGLCETSRGQYLLDARAEMGLTKRFPEIDFRSTLAFQGVASAVYDLGKIEKLAYRDASACSSAAK